VYLQEATKMLITEMELPISGKHVTMRRATGRDLVQAEMLAGKDAGENALRLAILSRITTVDGRVLPYEDFLDLDTEDINAFMNMDFPKPSQAQAPPILPTPS